MRLKKSEQSHIEAKGEIFAKALAKASMSVRSNGHLIGLDKIREPLALRAALRATGFDLDVDGFVIPVSIGPAIQETQDIVDAAYAAAVAAASA